jgi:hypothetical protein
MALYAKRGKPVEVLLAPARKDWFAHYIPPKDGKPASWAYRVTVAEQDGYEADEKALIFASKNLNDAIEASGAQQGSMVRITRNGEDDYSVEIVGGGGAAFDGTGSGQAPPSGQAPGPSSRNTAPPPLTFDEMACVVQMCMERSVRTVKTAREMLDCHTTDVTPLVQTVFGTLAIRALNDGIKPTDDDMEAYYLSLSEDAQDVGDPIPPQQPPRESTPVGSDVIGESGFADLVAYGNEKGITEKEIEAKMTSMWQVHLKTSRLPKTLTMDRFPQVLVKALMAWMDAKK